MTIPGDDNTVKWMIMITTALSMMIMMMAI
jgi:hypothetical protein